MKYHKQTILHDPKNGSYGDCYRTALACILDLDPHEVPHFMHGLSNDEGALFEARVDQWLQPLGYSKIVVAFAADLALPDLLSNLAINSPHNYFLLGGQTPRGNGVGHIVVGYHDKVIHDPHPSNCGVNQPMPDGFYWITYIGKKFPAPCRSLLI
jgi:hypothetical protein